MISISSTKFKYIDETIMKIFFFHILSVAIIYMFLASFIEDFSIFSLYNLFKCGSIFRLPWPPSPFFLGNTYDGVYILVTQALIVSLQILLVLSPLKFSIEPHEPFAFLLEDHL